MTELAGAQLAQARHYTYRLLSLLYLEGITADLLPTIQAVPHLAPAVPVSFDADEAAAEHQHLFGFNLFPYEAVFLEATGLLGGTVTEAVLHSSRQAGYQPDAAVPSPDHVGGELALLAYLAGREADAWTKEAEAAQERRRQAAFLHTHLLRWLPPLTLAGRRQASPFYAALAALTLDFLASERSLLDAYFTAPFFESRFLLPAPPPLLENEQTGLKELATLLVTPAHSGIFLSRDDIGRLARQHQLPCGFAGREQMLLNLLRSAARYDAFAPFLGSLQRLVGEWRAGYEEMATGTPALAPYIAVWQARTAETAHLLDQIDLQNKQAGGG